MRTPVRSGSPYVTLLRCQIGGAVPEPPEIGLEPHWLSVLAPPPPACKCPTFPVVINRFHILETTLWDTPRILATCIWDNPE